MKVKLSLIILLAFVLYSCGIEVELDDKKWSYENKKLKISFILKNNGYSESLRKVKIIAHKQRDIGHGAIVNDIIGEKIITVHLQPREEIKITDEIDLLLNLRPTMVVFNHFDAK